MKRLVLTTLISLPATFLMAATDSEFKSITSNNYQSALSLVNQSFGAWALPSQNIDIKSVWFNPAMMTYQGQQSSINVFNQPSGSVFFKAYGQNVGVHLGRTSKYTSDLDLNNEIDSYDLFWSKGKKGDSIGVNAYFSFDSDADVAKTEFENVQLQGTSTVTLEDDNIEVVVDENRSGTNEFDIGANIGFDKGLKQYVINIEISESTGSFDNFKATKTEQVNANTINIDKLNTVGTGVKNTRFTLGGSYIQKKDDNLFLIGSAKIVQELNYDETYNEVTTENDNDYRLLHRKTSENATNIDLTAGVQLEITPSPRIQYSIQQLVNFGMAFGKNKLEIIELVNAGTEETTGLQEQVKTSKFSINAPILVSMNMQATNKMNMTASVQSNALNLSLIKETDIGMEPDGDKYVESNEESILKNEFLLQTTSNTTVAWGLSYQLSNQLVFDFNTSSDFLTQGITDSAIVNELTITYQF